MKTKEEIDELYHKIWDDFINKYDDNIHYYSFLEGYTQCQKDMANEITQLKKDIQKLTFMIDNGLGFEDLKNDIDKYPH
jgi:hypothetical protein